MKAHLSFSNAVAVLALFVALGGTGAYAAATLKRNAVKAPHIATGAVHSSDVRDASLQASDFAPGVLDAPAAPEPDRGLGVAQPDTAAMPDVALRALTADEAEHADEADHASRAGRADTAGRSDLALTAANADRAKSSERADIATGAERAAVADDADKLGGRPADEYVLANGAPRVVVLRQSWGAGRTFDVGSLGFGVACARDFAQQQTVRSFVSVYTRTPGAFVVGPNVSRDGANPLNPGEELTVAETTQTLPRVSDDDVRPPKVGGPAGSTFVSSADGLDTITVHTGTMLGLNLPGADCVARVLITTTGEAS